MIGYMRLPDILTRINIMNDMSAAFYIRDVNCSVIFLFMDIQLVLVTSHMRSHYALYSPLEDG